MSDFSILLAHPLAEEIITKLITGTSSKDISQWLRLKYPDKEQKHLHISSKLLDEYANKHIGNLMEQLQKDVSILKSNPTPKIAASLLNNKTYRERLVDLIDQEVDIKKMIKELILMIRERTEQIFDRIQESPTSLGKGDYTLIKYFELLLNATEKFDKIHNNAPDQIIQHNITVQMVDKYKIVFQEAVRKTLAHMDTESSILFMEILSEELQKLEMPIDLSPTPETRMVEAHILSEMTIPSFTE